jgi:DNA-binding NtrC family response regulator
MTKTKILVVEDSQDYSALLAEWLSNYQIIKAHDLKQAQAAYDESIDAILLDMTLPDSSGMNGVDVLGKMGNAPIIVLTGLDEAFSPKSVISSGGLSFIRKDDLRGPSPLISAIEYGIAIKSLLDELESAKSEAEARATIMARGIGHYWTRMVRDFSLLYEFARGKITIETLDKHLNEPHGIDPKDKK